MAERRCARSRNGLAALLAGVCLPLLADPALAVSDAEPDVRALIAEVEGHVMAIDRLTVAPAGAWVTRILAVGELAEATADGSEPTAGIQMDAADKGGRLWVLGLPDGLETESLRVRGARVDREAGVRVEREVIRETPRYRRLQERLDAVRADARAVEVELEENGLRRGIARDQLAALVPGEAGLAALWRDGGPVADLMTRLSDERAALLERQAALREDIRALRAALDEMEAEAPGWRVGVTLNADPGGLEPDSDALRLEYRVENAGWEPVYRARLDTTERHVDWRMTARVHQQTGEDWPAVPMTLVTSDRRRFYPVPSLSPLTIGFVDPATDRPVRPLAKASAMLAESASRAVGARVEDETGFAASVAINKPSAVPSGDGGVNLSVLDQRLDAALELRVAPQSGRDAVVVAEFEPSIVHPLPAGRWELYRDGQQQAGQARAALKPEEPVELSFGVDPRLVVEYDQPPDERAEHGVIGTFRQVERVRRITVTSRHEQAVPVVVLMRLPTALDADIVVEPLADTSKPAVRDYDGQKGVWAYRRKLAPNEPWQIDFAYRVRWPEEKRISPF
ncbi:MULTISPECIES: DUF4139 domain-containing protein [unclassified Guyparkeria]|uniref:DUF4139 domain-containing protein n=1 Tax=unclassified Guyparkeria TaxID=2626246 RepID=UPI0007337A75|nr:MULTISPECIES: DUF4139 domain-containing protein [unclassified Guyparkeria]KTG17604.1 hypothetical protein AUR63_08130 [Guyparkeria sp. XI15]OAE88417.1 hypothetical protein AWR35_08145 [Guyparkeria sp. WRN-7]